MYRLCYILKIDGSIKSKNSDNADELTEFLLSIIDEVKAYKIINKITGEIIDKKLE